MKIGVDHAIAEFVGAFFPLFSDQNLALSFVIASGFSDYDPGFHYRATSHILIQRPMNNARVYGTWHEGIERFQRHGEIVMDLLSTHNSCWTDAIATFLRKVKGVGMDRYCEIDGHRWNEVSEFTTFSVFQKPTFLLTTGKGEQLGQERLGPWKLNIQKKLTLKEAAEFVNTDESNYTRWR